MSEWNEGTGTGPEILKDGKRMTAAEIFNGLMENEQLQACRAELEEDRNSWKRVAERRKSLLDQGPVIAGVIASLTAEKAQQQEWFANWRPTAENINALPEKLRQFVADLETQCDPAGMVAESTLVKDNCRILEQRYLQQQERIARLEKDLDRAHNAMRLTIGTGDAGYIRAATARISGILSTPHPAESEDIKPYWMDESEGK